MREHNAALKLKIICAVLTLCFIASIITMFSKAGLGPVTPDDVPGKSDVETVEIERSYNTVCSGDIIDRNESPIQENLVAAEDGEVPDCYGLLVGYYHPDYGSYGLRGAYKSLMQIEHKGTGKGVSLKLTTDNDIQEYVYDQFAGRDASVVVLEKDSGRILAMVSTDSAGDFNPAEIYDSEMMSIYNNVKKYWYPKYTLNDEPAGSIMKVFTAAVMLEAGIDDFVFDDVDGYIDYSTGRVPNCYYYSYGVIGLEDAFVNSVNTYFAAAAQKLGRYRTNVLADKVGFNYDIECDFGTVSSTYDTGTTSFDIASAAYGQGKTLNSTMSLAIMMQSICNRNTYLPHVIDSTFYYSKDGMRTVEKTEEKVMSKNVVSAKTSKAIDELMLAASASYGIPEELGIRSKTGTADITKEDGTMTNRATFLSYSDKYIVAISQHNTEEFGISLADEAVNIYTFMSEFDS